MTTYDASTDTHTTTYARRFTLAPSVDSARLDAALRASLAADPNVVAFSTQCATWDGLTLELSVEAEICGMVPRDRHEAIVGRHFAAARAQAAGGAL